MIDNNDDPIKGYSESKHRYSGKYDLNGNNENYMVSDEVYDDAIKSTNGASIIILTLLIVGGVLAIMMVMLFAELSAIPDEKIVSTQKVEVQDTRTPEEIRDNHFKTEEKYKDYPFERIDYISVDGGTKLYTIYGAIEYNAQAESIYDLDSTKYNTLTNIVEVRYYQDIPLQTRYDYVDWLLENGYVYAGVYNSETIYTNNLEDSYMFVSITPQVITYGVSDGNSSELFNN